MKSASVTCMNAFTGEWKVHSILFDSTADHYDIMSFFEDHYASHKEPWVVKRVDNISDANKIELIKD